MKLDRRKFLQGMGVMVPSLLPWQSLKAQHGFIEQLAKEGSFFMDFKKLPDRVWIAPSFWAVPMEDWRVKNGGLQFIGSERQSNLNVLEYQLEAGKGDFFISSEMGLKAAESKFQVGFTLGIQDQTDPGNTQAACYFGKGLFVGVSADGKLILGQQEKSISTDVFSSFKLQLTAEDHGGRTTLKLELVQDKSVVESLVGEVNHGISGLVAITCKGKEESPSVSWNNLHLGGTKVVYMPEESFGPILWTMYTLSDDKLKLTAQLPPIGKNDAQEVRFSIKSGKRWKEIQVNEVDKGAYTARFEVSDWRFGHDVPFKVEYKLDGKLYPYKGIVRKEPVSENLVLGGLTCQHASGYPYRPLTENLKKTNPDLLYFSGDQIYESNGGYPIKRAPVEASILSYLGKWYMFGWAFGEVMKDRPTICTPDDHDVFQGNLWGEGGLQVSIEKWESVMDAHGGFVQSVPMINVVNQTQTSHLPDPVKASPLKAGFTTWFTQLKYGRVSFAIVSDRIFKSGPEMLDIENTGRIDHIKDFYPSSELNPEGLNLVGEEQLEFLQNWVEDWQGVDMKVLLSQTLFANVCTYHGPKKDYLQGDLDSGGWPKRQRDQVLRVIRKASAFHVNGDQHIPFLLQYSLDADRDAGWTFCTPAISTGYPRWCQPDTLNLPFSDRPSHHLPNTGIYRDVFGNRNYIYATGNPVDKLPKEPNRYKMAQAKASGFGLITFDQVHRTIKMEAIRFLADLDNPSEKNTFPGWPLTISQLDNDGRKPMGYLPKIQFKKANEVIKIYHEPSGELIQALRVRGNEFIPAVYEGGTYRLEIGEADPVILKGIKITTNAADEIKV
ncbi:alkaline phosphatase D family protein [Echinicola salinicaeni]|uniref:alkaline phosphatase D family protein n=1 Tax=Echinicola salinicaeni TaxID=2762757 RepID=UPI001644F956|nr:alkaline phosphatase D family protein [Echinicola salinicaeni]